MAEQQGRNSIKKLLIHSWAPAILLDYATRAFMKLSPQYRTPTLYLTVTSKQRHRPSRRPNQRTPTNFILA